MFLGCSAWLGLSKKGFILYYSLPVLLLLFVLYTRGVNFNALFFCLPLYRGLLSTSNTFKRAWIHVNITLVFNFSQIMRNTFSALHCAKFVMQSMRRAASFGGRTWLKSINIASVLGCHTHCAHTQTHAYKMFNINICKFLEQRRRIKTHA